jgi:7-carboxy-7-deazaguanine synthase
MSIIDETTLEVPDKADKLDKARKKLIPLVEMFGPTVQGEGTVLGQQTYFLRFGLCDYFCKMCDSLHAVIPTHVKANATWLSQEAIWDAFLEFRNPNTTNWLTFSGGNPAIHDLSYLVGLAKQDGIKINVETQGTQYHGWLNKVDSLTISPKGPGMKQEHNHPAFMGFLDKVYQNGTWPTDTVNEWNGPYLCLKIVVFDERDLMFAREIFAYAATHPLFENLDTSNHFYLSLGNPNPPDPSGKEDVAFDIPAQLQNYRTLYEDILGDPILSKVRFTPQWHAFVWNNDKGH